MIAVAGALAQRPGRGGHSWVFLQYLLGLRRLGWEVLFLDAIDPAMAVDERGGPCPVGQSRNLRYLQAVMERYGLGENYSLIETAGKCHWGLPRAEVLRRVARSAAFVNVMGYLRDPQILAAAAKRVFQKL